jgi:hypothetical protein
MRLNCGLSFRFLIDEAVSELNDKYFDGNRLIPPEHIREELRDLRRIPRQSVRTAPDSVQGQAVRNELNRGLIAACQLHPVARANATGGVCLATAADEAYSVGALGVGDRLVRLSAAAVDIALSFVPVVSSVNDLAQVVHGMATGMITLGIQWQRLTTPCVRWEQCSARFPLVEKMFYLERHNLESRSNGVRNCYADSI